MPDIPRIDTVSGSAHRAAGRSDRDPTIRIHGVVPGDPVTDPVTRHLFGGGAAASNGPDHLTLPEAPAA
jgi:hypothetical protein